jgi:hypothetical protein
MRVARATTDQRPIFNVGRTRLKVLTVRWAQGVRRAPWLYIGASVGFVTFGFDTWRPLGFLITGVMFSIAEINRGG